MTASDARWTTWAHWIAAKIPARVEAVAPHQRPITLKETLRRP